MSSPRRRAALPTAVWALGLVSLFMDISSEMIHALLPVFIVGTLGAGAIWLGLIEGVAEGTACIVKVFSGALSDRWGRRKSLALLGYGLAAVTKPLFPLAGSTTMVFLARFVDRIGKGIRGAPRDALIADCTTPGQRGAAYGLRQSLDTVGAFAGPLLAIGCLIVLANDVRAVFWVAVIPALIAVAILVLAVKEPPHLVPMQGRLVDLRPRDLPSAFWVVAAVAATFTLARFSEAFLVLRAQNVGLAIGYVVWDEVPNALAMVGIAVIVGSGLYILHRERVRH